MGYTHTNSKGKTYHLHSKDVTLKVVEIKLYIILQRILDPMLVIYLLVSK